jgi:hypothetical protein
MTKISHRKKINEYFQDPRKEKVFDRRDTIVTLLNRCLRYTLLIPQGNYKCPRCDLKKVLSSDDQGLTFNTSEKRLYCTLRFCPMCEGKGYIDFARNAMKPQYSQTEKGDGLYLPFTLFVKPVPQAASMIFYILYHTNILFGDNFQFNINGNHNKKTVNDFFGYFINYKKARDKREKFIDKNFSKLTDQVIKKTKLSGYPPGKIACKACNGNPFGISRNQYNSEIELEICGNCYGNGYQSKSETKENIKYFFEIDYPHYPNYSSREDMLYKIVKTAEKKKDWFSLKLSQMESQESKMKAH